VSGYTPVFGTVFDGTLCGRWPALPVWLTILPMADKNGRVDITPEAIAARTGWPLDILLQGICELCKPDPRSRTKDEDGARLKLIDPNRDWGWQIVNHGKYREKARLMAKDSVRTESGQDAARKRNERSPPVSPEVPLSDSNTNTNTNSNACKSARTEPESEVFIKIAAIKSRYPKAAREDWITAEKNVRALITDSGVSWETLQAGVERYRKHCDATNRIPLNPSRFFGDVDRPWSQDWPIREMANKQRKTKFDQAMEALDRA
jgi:hypothetical protein